MPHREQVAHEALELGSTIARRYGNNARTMIVRHRNAAEAILRIADAEKVDAIILGVGIKVRIPGEWGKTSEEILRRAPCEVLFDKVPIVAQPIVLAM